VIYAHNWEYVGDERIPRWPSKINEPRPIKIDINSWRGISIGAKHVMLRVDEEENSWWSDSENSWVHVSCDSSNRGFSMSADVYTEDQAIELAIRFLRDVMSVTQETHVIEYPNLDYQIQIQRAVFASAPEPPATPS